MSIDADAEQKVLTSVTKTKRPKHPTKNKPLKNQLMRT